MTEDTEGREARTGTARTEIRGNEFPGPAAINTGSAAQHNTFNMTVPAQRRERVPAGLPPEPAGFRRT